MYAFSGCSSLERFSIPESVKDIYFGAFDGCSGLKSLYASSKEPFSISSGYNPFNDVDKSACTLYVPAGAGDTYRNAAGWSDFENIVEYDVTGIGTAAAQATAGEIRRYAADGQCLSSPSSGLNIVKYSDGTTRKVIVR